MTLAVTAPDLPPVPVIMPVITDELKAEAVKAMAREAADITFRATYGHDPETSEDRQMHSFRYTMFCYTASKAYRKFPHYSLEARLGVVAEDLGIAVYTAVTRALNPI